MKTMLLTRLALALIIYATSAQTWHTVDDFQYTPGRFSVALALTADSAGNLFVAGDAVRRLQGGHLSRIW